MKNNRFYFQIQINRLIRWQNWFKVLEQTPIYFIYLSRHPVKNSIKPVIFGMVVGWSSLMQNFIQQHVTTLLVACPKFLIVSPHQWSWLEIKLSTFLLSYIPPKNQSNILTIIWELFGDKNAKRLTLKRQGGQFDLTPVVFQKMRFSQKEWSTGFLSFNIIISHIFHEILLKFFYSLRSYEDFFLQY